MPEIENVEQPAQDAQGGSLAVFLSALLPLFRPYRIWLLCILFAMLVNLGFETCLPLSFKYLIDQAIVPHDTQKLVLILSLMAFGALMTTICLLGQDYAYARAETGILGDLRVKLFSHIQKLSMSFFGKWPLGDILSRFGSDISSVEQAVSSGIPATLSASIGLLISVSLLLGIEWRLALISVAGIALSFLGARMLERKTVKASYKLKQEDGKTASLLQENLGAQLVIKGFGLHSLSLERFLGQMGLLRKARLQASMLTYIMQRIPQAGALMVSFLVLGIGAYFAYRGMMSVGDLVAFNGLLMQVTNYVAQLTWAAPFLLQAAAGMQRIEDILSEIPRVQDPPGAGTLPSLTHNISFQQVTFSYAGDNEKPNLSGVDLNISKGTSVALVGSSGSGKSTVLNLILRFYDPDAGAVKIDDIDLKTVTQDSLRQKIGVVFQESLLFNTTIRENIRMGKLNATQEEIIKASRMSGVHDFVERMPDGYETVVGERGGRLSGGQRQRIGIARAMLRNPEILVLDEATSALDPATEEAINTTLKNISKGRTVLAVTHRLAPIADADRILVFDHGRLAEQGNHQQLLSAAGIYAQLWQKQSGFAVSPDGENAAVTAARLQQFPIFSKLDTALLSDLASMFVTEQWAHGREVIREGDPGNKFYIVVRGRLSVTKKTPSGEAKELAVLETGDHFGEIALLENVPRTASLRSLTPCVFLTLSRSQFLTFLEKAPEMRASLERTMTGRIQAQMTYAVAAN
jgi:ATP-binding cassette, subfamily B, bacterial